MRILIRLSRYGFRQKWHLVGAYLSMSASSVSGMIVPLLLGNAIDKALQAGMRSQLLVLAVVILAVSLLRGGFVYCQNYLSESVSQRAAYELRNDMFKKFQSLSFGFYDKQKTGDMMSKSTADVDAVRVFMSMWLLRGISIITMIFLISGVMLVINWRLGLVSLAFLPIVMFRAIFMQRSLKNVWTLVQKETGNMTTVLQENIAGMRVVKAFGAKYEEELKFARSALAVREHTYRATKLFAAHGSVLTLIFTIATAVILSLGVREISMNRLTSGDLAIFIFYMAMLMMPARMVGWLVNTMSRAASAGQRIFDILDAESPVRDKNDAILLHKVRGHVKFENVSMSYVADVDAVHKINFEVLPGNLIAILGTPGSGKSTLVHLIPRFYDPTEGRILIDGMNIQDVTLESLRKNIGIVMQDVFVFAGSVRDNIAYGAQDSTFFEIEKAAKTVQLHDFIVGQRQGYDTLVGERGITLSGGQRQRLAMARTLLTDPPVLILDDSTSSVDVGTEYEIQRALASLMDGRTTFVIAQRLSTVRQANLILVMDQGRIVESGTHETLFENDMHYRRIYDVQLKSQEEVVDKDTSAALKDKSL